MESPKPGQIYSKSEEIFNSISHGIGALLSIAGLVILVVLASRRREVISIVSFSIYGLTLLALYLSSTLYHSLVPPKAKKILRIFDHSTIYLLIAGSYTPITLIAMDNVWGWSIFGMIWVLALLGIAMNLINFEKTKKFALALYFLMGWLVVIAVKPLLANVPSGLLVMLLIGGLFYTFGIIFYAAKRIPFNHGIWHLFVLAGSISHYLGFLLFLK
ncbi:MAG: channel protein, hemolysin family [Firmicutes bacterium]|nr:channel protein, hemolysin family [Bacillota bacterium]